MLFNKSPEKFWDLISSRYAATPISDLKSYENKIKVINSYLSKDKTVLDIGCGTGTQCSDIADDVKLVTGIDISSKLLAIAEQRITERNHNNINFINKSFFDEPFQKGSFDVAMAFYVLHFFDDIDMALTRIHELLSSGGLFISETICLGEKNKSMGRLLRLAGNLGLLPKMNLLTTKKLESALINAGFNLVEKNKFSDSSSEYTIIAKKI